MRIIYHSSSNFTGIGEWITQVQHLENISNFTNETMPALPIDHASSSFGRGENKPDAANTYTLIFPFQLHDMLQEALDRGFEEVISWTPCGTSFKIHHQNLFENTVLPHFFSMTKYKSFKRQLLWYNFERVTRGHDNGK
jgi:hypothetical protein